MRVSAVCCALIAVAFAAAAGPAAAACYTPKTVAAVQHTMEPSTKAFLDLCLGKTVQKTVNKKKVTICIQCGPNSFDPGQNTGTCVQSCKSGTVWDAASKQCCTGVAPPLPVIK